MLIFFVDKDRCNKEGVCTPGIIPSSDSVCGTVISLSETVMSHFQQHNGSHYILITLLAVVALAPFALTGVREYALKPLIFVALLAGLPLATFNFGCGSSSSLCVACRLSEHLAWLYAIIAAFLQSIALFFLMVSVMGVIRGVSNGLNRVSGEGEWRKNFKKIFDPDDPEGRHGDELEARCIADLRANDLLPPEVRIGM